MKRLLILSVSIGLLVSSCNFMGKHVRGDGNVITQDRSISGFNSIDVSSALDVEIGQDSSYSVKVEVDNNLQQFVETYKEGDILRVRLANNINIDPTRQMKIYVSAPNYRRLEASGACGLNSRNRLSSNDPIEVGLSGACHGNLEIKAPKVSLDLSGASNLTLRGETKELFIQGSGSSDVKAFEMLSETADIDVSGAGNIDVFASAKINASASGASNIRYKGNASVNSDVSGAGSVKKVD